MSNPNLEPPGGPRMGGSDRGKNGEVRLRDWLPSALAALLLPIGLLAQRLAQSHSEWVEVHYSQHFFPLLAERLASLSGRVPSSLAEIIVGIVLLRFLFGLLRTCWRVLGPSGGALRRRLETLGFASLRLTGVVGILYAAYLVSWGFNHERLPFAEEAGFEVAQPKQFELIELGQSLADELIELRGQLAEDQTGCSRQLNTPAQLSQLAGVAYQALAAIHPSLRRPPGVCRRPVASSLMSASGISGIYFPLTAEAHVNGEIPESQLGFVTCHELAHSLGFAREDEANFLAYLAATHSDDASLRYSGSLAAFRYVLNALKLTSPGHVAGLLERAGGAVRRDLREIDHFWARERTSFTAVAQQVNHQYLKSQGHAKGVASYGLMVDLLAANWRQHRPNFKAEPLASALHETRKRSVRIAFVGGCFTAGGKQSVRFSFPDRVAELLADRRVKAEILNFGVCHQTKEQARAALQQVIQLGMDIVVVEWGSSDLENRRPIQEVEQSLEEMVFVVRRAGLRLLVLADLNARFEGEEERKAMLRDLIEKHSVLHIDNFGVGVRGQREFLRSELEHPNGAGIQLLAEQTIPRLRELVALVRRSWALESEAKQNGVSK